MACQEKYDGSPGHISTGVHIQVLAFDDVNPIIQFQKFHVAGIFAKIMPPFRIYFLEYIDYFAFFRFLERLTTPKE